MCHNWRSVVLASPSRLRLRLYFASNTPTRVVVLERLSHLPIIVDYSNVSWTASAPKRWSSALRYPNRVCKIAIRGTYDTSDHRITEVLNRPFPALESLELHNITSIERVLRSPSFMTSIRSLRHLQLESMSFTSVSSLLSVTRSLVNLALSINEVSSMEGASLLTHLRHMPHLRNLQVFLQLSSYRSVEMPPATSILLPGLSSFRFVGECTSVEWFVAGLDTPSLREFRVSVLNFSSRLDIPYLTKFLRAMGTVFVAAQLTILGSCLRTDMFTRPHSIDDPPSKIFTIKTRFSADPRSGLSAMLATLEDIFLFTPTPCGVTCRLSSEDFERWRKLFKEFRSVKVLRLHHGLERQVAEILRQPTLNLQRPQSPQKEANPDVTTPSGMPITTSNRSQFFSHIFPSLEEIVLYAGTPDRSIRVSETERASMLELFGPFVTARQEVGRPVKVFWSTDGLVPRYSVADPGYYST